MNGVGRRPAAAWAAALACVLGACGGATVGAVGHGPPPPAASALGTARSGGVGAVVTPAGIVAPVVSDSAAGWVVRTPCGATATLALSRATPVGAPEVVLDPGHGGVDPGAVAPDGLTEAGVNLAVARQAQAALEAAGIPTLLSRTGDYTLALATRSELARDVAPRAFVSIHHNADPDGPRAGPGTQTFYQVDSADSKRLAGLVYEEVVRALSAYGVAWVADRDAGATYRRGAAGDYYAVLRESAPVVSALAELAYVSNPPEAALLARADVQRVEGQAVARGILRYLTTSDPGSGFTAPEPRAAVRASPPAPCHDPTL